MIYELIVKVLINIFLFYLLLKLIKVSKILKEEKEASGFTDKPVVEGCKIHKWKTVFLYENKEGQFIKYCADCGFLSEEGKLRYFKEAFLKKVKLQEEILLQFTKDKEELLNNLLKALNLIEGEDRKALLEKFLEDNLVLNSRVWSQKLDLMGINGRK